MPRRPEQPVRILQSGLTGRFYAVTRYEDTRDGENIVAQEKHNVTDDVRAIIDAAVLADRELPTCLCDEDIINAVGCQCGAEMRREFLRQRTP